MRTGEVPSTMKRMVIAAALPLMYFTSPIPAQQAEGRTSIQAMSLCTVISNASAYNGKEIVVSGRYRMVIHGTILMDGSCAKTEVNLRESSGYKANRQAATLLRSLTQKDRFRPVDVVFRGIFRVAREGQCFGQICASFEIETTELLTAHPT